MTRHSLTLSEALAATPRAAQTAGSETASWCGSATQADTVPNFVAGHAAHWIYAVPSDGQGRLAAVASTMQSDAEAVDAWWRSQDPTRSPRFDLAQLSCGAQLDISSLRLTRSSAQLRSQDSRFEDIVLDVSDARFESRFDKYVVYYDGPSPSEVCGEGGGFSSGLGYAVVYLQACQEVETAIVAVHELVHTYGVVPQGAPHMCPAPSTFHVCDDEHDLMYPFADGSPLTALTLDSGRDDYYGHAGSWADLQDSPWLVQHDRQVQFSVSATGAGTIGSDVPGLQCSASCTTTWNADTTLVLTATPTPATKFVRWGGACSGSFTCTVRVGQSAPVSAFFAPLRYRLRVSVAGKGAVHSSSGGIACPRHCSAAVASYTPFRIAARAAAGWRFEGWRGSCRGKRSACTLPMTGNASVRAVFVRR